MCVAHAAAGCVACCRAELEEDTTTTKSRWAHIDDFEERKMPPARMWRDKSDLGRLRRAGLAYTEDEVLANPDLRGLEA